MGSSRSSIDFTLEGSSSQDPSAEARWYAVQCQTHREKTAAFHLANQQFEVFLPCREKTRHHARRIETVRVPFFPGYLFTKFDITRDRWRAVNGTCGVVRLVAQGDNPSPVPRGVVEALFEASDEDGLLRWQPSLKPGQRVRVATGPLAGFVGELERMTDSQRVRVLLDIMGGHTTLTLPLSQVVPAESSL